MREEGAHLTRCKCFGSKSLAYRTVSPPGKPKEMPPNDEFTLETQKRGVEFCRKELGEKSRVSLWYKH